LSTSALFFSSPATPKNALLEGPLPPALLSGHHCSLAAKKLGGFASKGEETGSLGLPPEVFFKSILSKTLENTT